MTLQVIGAGLGRTGTLSLKLALEHIGLGPCYHMSEMLSHMRTHLPRWIEAARGNTDRASIFAGYKATCDYPGCTYWRELAAAFPDAKIILTVRDPESWFESVSNTIFSPHHRARLEGDPVVAEFFERTVFNEVGPILGDRNAMIDYFNRWNSAVIDEVPADRLLVYRPGDGWEPLCNFLSVPIPPEPYPRVNSRSELTERTADIKEDAGPPPPELFEAMIGAYLNDLRDKAFPTAS